MAVRDARTANKSLGGTKPMKIKIVGAGPAGLHFAALMKLHDPSPDLPILARYWEGDDPARSAKKRAK